MKFLAVFAIVMVAAVSADVSHLKQYLPPFETSAPVQAAPVPQLPINKYLPPVQQQAAPAPIQYTAPAPQVQYTAPVYQAPAQVYHPAPVQQAAPQQAASFSEQSGYSYNLPQ